MFLGIDLGTTGVKVVLIDTDQKLIGTVTKPLSVSRPKPLWSEQDPHDWWQATQDAMASLKKKHKKAFAAMKAIGLSGQMHGATLLDKHHQVLRPAILWNDGRSVDESAFLTNQTNALEIVGNLIMPGFTAPKLLWVKKHEPEIFAQIAKVLLPKDYLRFKLSGDFATDMSDASGTGWLNIAKRAWSDDMITACDLTEQQMPECFEGNAITGTLLPELAKAWGMPLDTKIVAGAGDNAASAMSTNTFSTGDAFLSLGTSGVYFVASDTFHANPGKAVHAFCHCLPNLWHQMTVHLSAASCLEWATQLLKLKDVRALIDLAKEAPETRVIFLPYLSGERTPHNNPYARSVFFGMDHDTVSADLAQAVLEGVAFALADGQAAMLEANIDIKDVAVVGGGARSFYWGKILASALGRPLQYRADRSVGAAFGAARLAFLAIHGGDPKAVFPLPELEQTQHPSDTLVETFKHKQPLFNDIYNNLKPTFKTFYERSKP